MVSEVGILYRMSNFNIERKVAECVSRRMVEV